MSEAFYYENDFEKTYESNRRLITHVIKRYLNITDLDVAIDYEDLVSIANFSIYKAFITYSKNKNIKWSTYVCCIMENDLRIVFREMQSKKRLSNILKISLDETYYKDSDTVSKVTLKDIIPDRKNLEDEIIANMFLNDLLSEKEKDLIELRLEGKDQRAIAKMFNLSQPEISRRLLKIKKKIRNFNEVNGY